MTKKKKKDTFILKNPKLNSVKKYFGSLNFYDSNNLVIKL